MQKTLIDYGSEVSALLWSSNKTYLQQVRMPCDYWEKKTILAYVTEVEMGAGTGILRRFLDVGAIC